MLPSSKQKSDSCNNKVAVLKGLCHGILSYIDNRQNYRESEGNLKIMLYKDGKTLKR